MTESDPIIIFFFSLDSVLTRDVHGCATIDASSVFQGETRVHCCILIRDLHEYKFLHPKPNRLFFLKPGPKPDPNTSTRTGPDPTDTFKNMINFSNFYFIKNIKNIQRNSIFSSTPMVDESLNHHQIHFDSIFSILIIVKN